MKVVMDVGSMLQKWLVVSVFVIEISFWGDDAHCQFFPLELSNSDSDNPADFSIRIASESPCALTKHHSKVLARHQQHLDAAVGIDGQRLAIHRHRLEAALVRRRLHHPQPPLLDEIV